MAPRRTEIELAVERDIADAAGIVRRFRLVARYPLEGAPMTPEEIAPLFQALSEELDRSLPAGTPLTTRPDRSLLELVETYRPRQPELLELLREEGEITHGEFAVLQRHLGERAPAAVPDLAPMDRPIAAAPLAQDRTPIVPRAVDDLLRLYHIESLKQAGAVRARRQISYEEYMALKRHFGAADGPPAAAPVP
ncbi:MAG: hypothetical protein L3K06_00040 [Thermoplasmata archaeon]|nr:hypothetical protein [Thermoplasmata archaeon]MCI4353739.1 hypothetical protein [Thermoplasmata archaeon]